VKSAARGPHPFLYFLLFLPFGATTGYVQVTLGALAAQHGLGVAEAGALVATSLLPQTFKFLWAPFTDAISTRKRWYIGANLVSSATLACVGLVPLARENLATLEALIFVNSIAASFVGMAVEGLMAQATPTEGLGAAGGWSQAGNLGGSGIGGGLALILAVQLGTPKATVILAILLLLCNLALIPLPTLARAGGQLGSRFREVGRDLKALFTSSRSILPLALCFLPAGAAAASGLFSSTAGTWHASVSTVGWLNGGLAGVIMIPGSLAGGWLSDRMSKRTTAYAVTGAILAAATLAVLLLPTTEWAYVILCVSYSFVTGMTYGAFSAFALESSGGGAAASRYTIFASLSNIPITYMTTLDSRVAAYAGPRRMLGFDALAGVAGLILFFALAAGVRRFLAAPPAAPDATA
jgi:PAT family beta-lactamase induction signal transducer AmpG